ncbi:MAG: DMT family transporter [Firmicutes bacterium]|nr:DMT family transporter [Bacillota bacterium]
MRAWRTRRAEGLALLILTTVLWGSTFPLVQGAVARMPPLALVSWRFGVAAVLLLPWLSGGGGVRAALPGLGVGLANAAGFLLQTFALRTAGADTVAFLTGLSVVLVPAAEALWRRRWPSRRVALALLLGLTGLALMTLRGGLGWSSGDLLGALCAVMFALQVLGTAHLAPRVGSGRLAAQEVLAGAVAFPLCAVASGHAAWLSLPPRSEWALILYLGAVATVGTFLLQSAGQARVSATAAAVTFNLEPVFAAAWAYVLDGQLLDGPAAAGAAFVLAGMGLAAIAPGEGEAPGAAPGGLVPVGGEGSDAEG